MTLLSFIWSILGVIYFYMFGSTIYRKYRKHQETVDISNQIMTSIIITLMCFYFAAINYIS
jgi:hypothetical protein